MQLFAILKSIGLATTAIVDTLHQIERTLDKHNGNNSIANRFSEVEDRGTELDCKFVRDYVSHCYFAGYEGGVHIVYSI